jgi:transposase
MFHVKGKSRNQLLFLPNSIEEYVEKNNPVRIIDAFVDMLDLKKLGFLRVEPAPTGRPSYDPADLLKLYIYGYMNKIRSSRRLMIECRRNIELFYLLNELTPDFRTIADFRKDNAEAIRKVFREFTFICSDMGLYKKELIAIDGTKVRAQNADDKVYNKDILVKKLARIDAHISEYMDAIKKNDESGTYDEEDEGRRLIAEGIHDKLEDLRKRKSKYTGYLEDLESTGKTQILETDPECHRMHTRNGFHCCYNIQTATDAGSHLICAYEVTDKTNDLGQLENMSTRSREALGAESMEVVADKGYDSRADILNTLMQGIIPNVALKIEKEERLYNIDYKPSVITDNIRESKRPDDIQRCLSAAVLPALFENSVVSVELQKPSGIACFSRLDDKQVLCPMGKILRFVKRRRGTQTIFRSYEACRTCDNRCKASANAKEVCFVDGARHVPVVMYGDSSKVVNTLPKDYAPHHSSRALLLGRKVSGKVVIRVKCDEEKVHTRMCTVEHPFGSIKWYGDAGYVLCRGKRKVSAEIGLSFLAYNMKRAIKMAGTEKLLKAMGD